jgi:chaperonin cofactor prefoldin|tara:strand:+ start:424 stop:699 length:276 start_codon:yes stop_codon:yes gene_type:complete
MKKVKNTEVENPKITENELKSIQSMLNAFNQLKMQLGDLELSKGSIIDQINKVKADYQAVEKELSEKYGDDSQIDLATGSIVKIDKEEKTE